MYNKFLIVACKKNLAGMNIITNLSQFRDNPVLSAMKSDINPTFDFYITEEESLYNENLDLERINKYDFIIFAYTHKSEKGDKSLCIHAPGSWRNADLGGEPRKVSPTSALFQKFMFEKLNENMKQFHLDDKYKLTLEATHHGPLIEKPCLFIEIGSTENEWRDRKAGFVIAKTISDSIKQFKKSKYTEVAIAIGGPHYCPNFNKLQLKSNVAISHVIPNYVAPITEEMIKEALDKTEEEVDYAVVDWKGLGTSDKRDEVISILEKMYIRWKKTSDVGKHG